MRMTIGNLDSEGSLVLILNRDELSAFQFCPPNPIPDSLRHELITLQFFSDFGPCPRAQVSH